MDRRHRLAQAADLEAGQQPPASGVALAEELGQRRVEAAVREPLGLGVVDDPEARVEAEPGRIAGEQPAAEAVDRRDRGALEGDQYPLEAVGGGLVAGLERFASAVGERRADPLAELARGALGEREGEDRGGGVVLAAFDQVADRGAVAVGEHARLPGPGPGREQDVAITGVDRAPLLGRRLAGTHSAPSSSRSGSSGSILAARSILQTDEYSQ